jgi:polyhydroxyalkanoate synthesis regulator phasin
VVNDDLEHKLRRRIDELWDQRDRARRENHALKTRISRLEKQVALWRTRASRR